MGCRCPACMRSVETPAKWGWHLQTTSKRSPGSRRPAAYARSCAPEALRSPKRPGSALGRGIRAGKAIFRRIGGNPEGLSGRVRAPAAKPTARRRSQWKIQGGGHLSTRKIGPEGGDSARILSTALLPPPGTPRHQNSKTGEKMDKSGTGSVIGVCQLGGWRTHRPESPDLHPGRRHPRPGSRVLFALPVKGRDLGQKTGFPFLGLSQIKYLHNVDK